MKTTQNFFTRMMTMSDSVWERHSNPLSVWTRVITGLPLILGALWSIRLIEWWSVAVFGGVCVWIWLNPRIFSPPSTTDNWASKVTFGERVWLNRKTVPIPAHHVLWANSLSLISGVGFLAGAFGAVQHDLLLTLLGGTISWFGKMWFCDRMVWLFDNMKETHATYASWLKR
tara:strand:+ start:1037 stop:1552 length:516 start_codon:yes stop_codon:yes gene_type:complete